MAKVIDPTGLGPFKTLMSDFWNESGDIYLGSFANALNRYCDYLRDEDLRRLIEEFHIVEESGLLGDIKSPAGVLFWSQLGDRALMPDEFVEGLEILNRRIRHGRNI